MSLHFMCPAWIQHILYAGLLITIWILYISSDPEPGIKPRPRPGPGPHPHPTPEKITIPDIILVCTTISKVCAIMASFMESSYLRKRTRNENFRARTISVYTTLYLIMVVSSILSFFFWGHWRPEYNRTVSKSRTAWILANVSDIIIITISTIFIVFLYKYEFSDHASGSVFHSGSGTGTALQPGEVLPGNPGVAREQP